MKTIIKMLNPFRKSYSQASNADKREGILYGQLNKMNCHKLKIRLTLHAA